MRAVAEFVCGGYETENILVIAHEHDKRARMRSKGLVVVSELLQSVNLASSKFFILGKVQSTLQKHTDSLDSSKLLNSESSVKKSSSINGTNYESLIKTLNGLSLFVGMEVSQTTLKQGIGHVNFSFFYLKRL